MAKLTIDTGAAGNPATGDTLRTAMTKVNANFTEIYNELGSDGTFSNIGFTGNSIISDDTNGDIILDPNGSGSIVVDATIRNRATNANIVISPNGTGALDVDTSRIINVTDPTSAQDAATKAYVDSQVGGVSPTTFVGDDSTGTAVNPGETFKFAGTQNITTAVSGDTLTITGPDLSSYATTSYVDAQNQSQALTFVGDDSTGTAVNSGETFKIAGTQNVTTAVSGDTLTITGPDLSSYLTTVAFADLTSKPTTLSGYGITDAVASSSTAVTMVGDDSTGTGVNIGETFKIAGTQNVTTAVSGDTLTITGPDLSSYATQSYVTSQGYITNSTTTIVGDDSTGTTINSGETFKIAGTQNITTAVSGDTLTITGPDLSSYLTSETSHADVLVDGDFASAGFMKTDGAGTYSIDANTYLTSVAFGDLTSTPTTLSGYGITDAASSTATAVTVVGDDSTGTAVTLGETFKIAGTQNITTAVSGDTLTITGPDLSSYLTDNGLGDLTVTGSTISSPSNADLTLTTSGTGSVSIEAIQIKGTELSSTDSTQITVKEDLKVTGTTYTTSLFLTSEYGESQITSQSVTANELRTNEIKSRGSNADINIDPEGTGRVVAKGALEIQKGYIESINTLTSSSTITVDFSEASVHTVTLAENAQFVVTNLPTGATGTIIITQDGGGSNTGSFGTDGSTAVKFAGGTPTLSTAGNAIDVVTVFNDGTNYLGNIAKAYAA